ncbi:MAG: NAD(P)/FAD-dependent oxidoreductase [Candidatus Omnitrophica bacterium]|nr:NAD(P)/FAD-dependent oxidoreductase [Candidatus Omnitrophota bacterium]
MKRHDIIIIGAGPAGMMAAIRAGQLKKQVLLIEKNNRLGQKLLISGKGRCNITNIQELDGFISNFSHTGEFLRSAFAKFFNNELMKFLETKGLRLKTERGGRVFPKDDRSDSVLKVLKSYLDENRTMIVYNSPVTDIKVGKNGEFSVELKDKGVFKAAKLILATGGLSYPLTGSTGDGFAFARGLGHRIVDLSPGLVPFETKEHWVRDLQGLSLKNVRIEFSSGKKSIVSAIGEMLFTHFGVSGPLILELSSKVVDLLNETKNPVKLSIDMKPGLSQEQLDRRLIRDFESQGSKIYKNLLAELLPAKLIDVFVKVSGIPPNKKANQLTQEDRRRILRLLKDFSLTITRPRPIEEAIVTRGGVSTKEIDPRTMQSRLVKGLYFCGEIIDVDAVSGGYNLQAAFSTGFLAGESAGKDG